MQTYIVKVSESILAIDMTGRKPTRQLRFVPVSRVLPGLQHGFMIYALFSQGS